MIDAVRLRADALGTARPAGRFRSHTNLEDGSDRENRVVDQAIARAQSGDPEAVRFLYMRYADNVYGYVRSIVKDHHEAEDVTQHVFAKLMTVIAKYERRSVPFSAWILRVARNVALDQMRQRRPVPSEDVREPDPSADGDSERHRSLVLRDALATLPEDQREVVVLRHLVGLTPGEIAGRLGRTEPSVHGLHHRGRGALCSALNEMECAPTIGTQVAA